MGSRPPKTLYLCYFGLREPLVQTQVLPYLREIGKGGVEVSLLTFEPEPSKRWTPEQFESERRKLAGEGIRWYWKTYHKRPSVPATLFDILSGAVFTWRRIRRGEADIVHARIHVPAAMAALAKTLSRRKPKILFDIRGFFPEEYTDAGVWKPDGLIYRSVKRVERWLLRKSDGFVVLTEKARKILFPASAETGADSLGRPVEVIPCCVDLERFRVDDETIGELVRKEIGAEGRFVSAYVGSFGGWYMTEEMADYFQAARERDPKSFALILTRSDPAMIGDLLSRRGLAESDYFIASASPEDVPRYLSAADVAISFIKPCFSKLSSSPTKIAEYLISGVPVISNRGVGDIAELIEDRRVGEVIERFDAESYSLALERLAADGDRREISGRCRRVAEEEFDLRKTAGERYRRIYRRLLGEE